MTINTAEIEARLAKATPGPWEIMPFGVVRLIRSRSTTVASVKSGPEHKHDGEFIAHAPTDIAALLAALKAETARADKAENGLLDEAERSADLQSQLTAANEKLAAYAKAEKDAAELYDWVMSVCENPPEPTPALRAVWEKYKDLPAFSTGDGNGR